MKVVELNPRGQGVKSAESELGLFRPEEQIDKRAGVVSTNPHGLSTEGEQLWERYRVMNAMFLAVSEGCGTWPAYQKSIEPSFQIGGVRFVTIVEANLARADRVIIRQRFIYGPNRATQQDPHFNIRFVKIGLAGNLKERR